MGEHTLSVPASLHQLNRQRLVDALAANHVPKNSIIVLQGGETQTMYCSDVEPVFRQESYFHWTFGVTEADCYGAIEVDTNKAHLFFPKLPESYSIWMGRLHQLSHYQDRYQVDDVHFVDDVSLV